MLSYRSLLHSVAFNHDIAAVEGCIGKTGWMFVPQVIYQLMMHVHLCSTFTFYLFHCEPNLCLTVLSDWT